MFRTILVSLLSLCALASCQSIAAVTQLPPEAARTIGFTEEDLQTARGPAMQLPVERFEIERVEGSGLSFVLDGTPSQVRDMLLDFDGANGRRVWCKRYKSVSLEATKAKAVWYFKRYKIFEPVVTLLYDIHEVADSNSIHIEFHAEAPVPGVAALFGEYQLYGLDGEVDETLMRAQVFIDTGFPIGVSEEDMADGLRKDARALRAWIKERL